MTSTIKRRGDGPALLTKALRERNLSASRYATVIGISRQHVSVLQKTSDAVPSLEVAIAMEETLGIPPRSWVRDAKKPAYKPIPKATPKVRRASAAAA